MTDCVYLDGAKCRRFPTATCEGCQQGLGIADPDFHSKWVDQLLVVDRDRMPTHALRNMLAGGGAFLMGGGPSANDLPLELLAKRGTWTFAVNNSAGHPRVRPQAFVCADPPMKFSHSIWLDPGIAKFVPTPKMGGYRAKLRKKVGGLFGELGRTVTECPNVWGFQRHSWFRPDDSFFLTDGACWGNHDDGVRKTGRQKTVCTMLLALRLLVYLGARRIYLVGVDFRMQADGGYSFDQGRTPEACASNNSQFHVINEELCKMQADGVFSRFGVSVFNCYERSGLRAFPYLPFEDAVRDARGLVEERPDLAGWYEK